MLKFFGKISLLNFYLHKAAFSRLTKPCLAEAKDLLKKPAVFMCKDQRHVICFHPEPSHPYEFSKPIERKIEKTSPLNSDMMNIYLARFDTKPATNPAEHWSDALRLSKTFNEHPITFKRADRRERIKNFMAKTNPIKKNRESI